MAGKRQYNRDARGRFAGGGGGSGKGGRPKSKSAAGSRKRNQATQTKGTLSGQLSARGQRAAATRQQKASNKGKRVVNRTRSEAAAAQLSRSTRLVRTANKPRWIRGGYGAEAQSLRVKKTRTTQGNLLTGNAETVTRRRTTREASVLNRVAPSSPMRERRLSPREWAAQLERSRKANPPPVPKPLAKAKPKPSRRRK